MPRDLVARYADPTAAQAAFEDVLATGHPRDRVQIDLGGTRAVRLEAYEAQDRAGLRGALTGMGVGAVLGALLAIVLGLTPTVGWVLGNDPSASIIGSAFGGALLGFVVGGLSGGMRRRRDRPSTATAPSDSGPSTVRVDAEGADVALLTEVLRRHGPLNLQVPEAPPAFEPVGPPAQATRTPESTPSEPRPTGSRVLDLDMARRQVRPEPGRPRPDEEEEPQR